VVPIVKVRTRICAVKNVINTIKSDFLELFLQIVFVIDHVIGTELFAVLDRLWTRGSSYDRQFEDLFGEFNDSRSDA
jgi:hypothetical protein